MILFFWRAGIGFFFGQALESIVDVFLSLFGRRINRKEEMLIKYYDLYQQMRTGHKQTIFFFKGHLVSPGLRSND